MSRHQNIEAGSFNLMEQRPLFEASDALKGPSYCSIIYIPFFFSCFKLD